jgi:hypothetical protein
MRRVGMSVEIQRLMASPLASGLALAAAGFFVWVALSIVGGLTTTEPGFHLRDAWDTAPYFYVGVPIMVLGVAVVAFLHPERAWRWPLWLVSGHQVGVLTVGLGMQSGLSLLILTLILAVLLSALFAIPALIGAEAARRLTERAY